MPCRVPTSPVVVEAGVLAPVSIPPSDSCQPSVREATDGGAFGGHAARMKEFITKTAASVLNALAIAGQGMAPYAVE
jgi:hypothetical protein